MTTSKPQEIFLYKEKINSITFDFIFFTVIFSVLSYITILLIYSYYTSAIMPVNKVYLAGLFILLTAFTGLFINFKTLSIKLTNSYLKAGFGLISIKIKPEQILEANVYHYKFRQFFGWGVRYDLFNHILAFNLPEDNYQGILIIYTRKEKVQKLFLSSRSPDYFLERLKIAIPELEISEKN
jgi:hypothetical protein